MKSFSVYITFLTILLWLPSTLLGEPLHKFHLDHRDGLNSNYVRSIAQDGHGFIWVATGDGLSRFDGGKFKSFTKEFSGLTSNELNCLLPDPQDPDIMWISTRRHGLCHYDYKTGEISPFDGKICSKAIPHLSAATDGGIWVTHYHNIPDYLNTVTGEVEPLFSDTPQDFPRPVWCTVEDPSGTYLYVGHEGAGMTRVSLKDRTFKTYRPTAISADGPGGASVYTIIVDRSGKVWLGTDKGVSIFNPTTEKFENISSSTADADFLPGAVKSIMETSNGDIWCATTAGGVSILPLVSRMAGGQKFFNLKPYDNEDPYANLSSSYIYTLFEDSFGNKWLGNYSAGLDVVSYEPPFFNAAQPFPYTKGRPYRQSVWSIARGPDEQIWIGGEDEMININGKKHKYIQLPTATKGHNTLVRAILPSDNDILLIGTSNDGIFAYTPATHTFSHIDIPEKEIRCFVRTPEGRILAGTHSGIYICDISTLKATPDSVLNNQLLDHYITGLTIDSNGYLWVGTFGEGATVFTPAGKALQYFNADSGLPSNTVNAMREDTRGNMWVATRDGVAGISIDSFDRKHLIGNKEGLVNCDVKTIEEDAVGNLWLGTNHGIVLYLSNGQTAVYERNYTSMLGSFTENASTITTGGRIFLGSLNGLIHFNPKNMSHTPVVAKVSLTSMTAHDSNSTNRNMEIEIPISEDKIELPYNLNTFTLRFNILDITRAANSEYVYNMKGVNEVWTKVKDDNSAIYRNLRPGNYEFRVRHRLNGQDWSEPQTIAYITIQPPVYATWWAIMLYIITIISLILFFVNFYKHKMELEKNLAVERENSMNIKALNEERLVFFTNITHELHTPPSLIIGPMEDLVNDQELKESQRKKLLTIRTSSMRLLNLINGILEFRKTETRNRKLEVIHGNLANFVREIGLRFKELNNNPDVNITIDVAEMEEKELYYDPEMISTVINNLMGNALKYTHKGNVTLSLRPTKEAGVKYVDLSVSDTGTGISAESLPHVFERYYQASNSKKTSGTGIGLALTKNLVELHEGTISVTSTEGHGSTFNVRLIMDNSYPNAAHRNASDEVPDSCTPELITAETSGESKLVMLVVEDDNDVREYIAQSFTEDFTVLTASNGREGLETALREIPDIVVSDIMMPEMDGFELCNTLKTSMATSHIPVILLTAKDSLRDREEGYDSGADSYITKPFSASLLRARINNIIESRHKLTLNLLDEPTPQPATTGENISSDKNGCSVTLPPQPTQPDSLGRLDKEFIARFRTLVEENMEMEEFDQTFLTDKMCMSHSTLYRKVKSIAGLTPNEFIRKIKLRRAADLIQSGEVQISDVAYMTGFSSAAYFRRIFKKEYGVTPTEYAQKLPSSTNN